MEYVQSYYSFPDEFLPPEDKEQAWYGLQEARAQYYNTNRYGSRLFQDNSDFDALTELSQGRQSVDKLYRSFSFGADPNAPASANSSLAWIDVQVLPLAPKYINRAVAKLQRFNYDIALTAVDPISVDEAKAYNAAIKTFYKMKTWFDTMPQLNIQDFFPGLDVSILPEYPDELLFNMEVNQKIKKIIDAEKSLMLINAINKTQEELRLFDWDQVVYGRGHLHCYLDENNIPRIKRINPKYWIGSYVDGEDFTEAEYQGFIDFITVNQFKKEAEKYLEPSEIERVIRSYAFNNGVQTYSASGINRDPSRYDGLDYIPVYRFYFLSDDTRLWEIWRNTHGEPMVEERDYEYKITPRRQAKYNGTVHKTTRTYVYGGNWVIDSDIVYNYRRLPLPETTLIPPRLPIITFAPNMKEGRIVSLAAQMTEPLYMINVCHNKIKDILAKGRMGILELDFNAMENVALGQGGEMWKPYDVYKLFLQTNILVKRQNLSQYGQALGKAIEEKSGGLTLTDYFNTMKTYFLLLDDLTGSTVVESGQMPDRLTTDVMRANVAAGADSIEYLVNSRVNAYEQVSHCALLWLQVAKRNKATIKGMIPALGTTTTEYFEVPDQIAYCEYGLVMERQPGPEEWANFYRELEAALVAKLINASDSAFIRCVKNMKMARYILAVREKVNEAKNAKMLAQQQQFQLQAASQGIQEKMAAERQLAQEDQQRKIELMAIQAKIDDALQTRKILLESESMKTSDLVKQAINRQAGIDSVLKEAIRAKSEYNKADKQHDAKVIAANRQAAATIASAEISAKAKKEKSSDKAA